MLPLSISLVNPSATDFPQNCLWNSKVDIAIPVFVAVFLQTFKSFFVYNAETVVFVLNGELPLS